MAMMIRKEFVDHSEGYPDFPKSSDTLLEAECTSYLILDVNEKRS